MCFHHSVYSTSGIGTENAIILLGIYSKYTPAYKFIYLYEVQMVDR